MSATKGAERRYVSIHAPGRGATLRVVAKVRNALRFNSRTREGCDQELQQEFGRIGKFQFTHPGGVRRVRLSLGRRCVVVSIHAPGRGATGDTIEQIAYNYVSIHAPGRGATGYVCHHWRP